jgi:hypothetical protein
LNGDIVLLPLTSIWLESSILLIFIGVSDNYGIKIYKTNVYIRVSIISRHDVGRV